MGVALSAVTLVFAQAQSEQPPIQYVWGKVIGMTGDSLMVQTDTSAWEFRLIEDTQFKISSVENTLLDNTGLEETTQDSIHNGDLVAVLTQLEGGAATDRAEIVVVMPLEADGNLPPAGIQPTQNRSSLTNGSALPCKAQIDGAAPVYGSPQEAVDVASSGDLIKVSGYCAGVFTRHSLTQSVYADKSLAFIGGYDPDFNEPPDPILFPTTLNPMGRGRNLVISRTFQVDLTGINLVDGNAANLTGDPVIMSEMGGNIFAAEDSALNMYNSAVENGRATIGGGLYLSGTANISGTTFNNNIGVSTGGGIFNGGGEVSITNSTFDNNIGVGIGGGLYNISGTVTIAGSIFIGNFVNAVGGGLYNNGGVVNISESTFSGNYSPGSGGGISTENGKVTIDDSTISDNYATGAGGGVINLNGPLSITYSIFQNNSSTGTGGGVINSVGEMVIANSTFRGNSVSGSGGGISNSSGKITIDRSTLQGNYASIGGGIFNSGTTTNTIINSTISRNRADNGSGGGIYNSNSAMLVINNTTIAENSSFAPGGGIYNDGAGSAISMTNSILAYHSDSGDCGGDFTSATSFGYNLSNDDTCSFLVATNDITDTNPLLGPLQFNGGPTETHLPMDSSQAIDTANPAACPDIDQRGVNRPADGDGDDSAVCDRGSVEVASDVIYLPVILISP